MQIQETWDSHRAALYHFILRRMPTAADAEDILQSVFLTAQQKQEQLLDKNKIVPWLYQVARNQVKDFYRSPKRRELSQVDYEGPSEPTPEVGIEKSEVAACLQLILDFMPAEYGGAVRLSDIDGKSSQEVADALGLSLPGAKSRVQRGRKMIRDMLDECLELEFDAFGAVLDSSLRPHNCRFCTAKHK